MEAFSPYYYIHSGDLPDNMYDDSAYCGEPDRNTAASGEIKQPASLETAVDGDSDNKEQ